ncbi:MAG: YdeI/OmpD-associated family protein [Propioniciclava sp.]
MMPAADEAIVVADGARWRAWLDVHENTSDGVWLVLAKKGVTEPTALSYAEALDEALCSGWIDGQRRSRDKATFVQRFTPRRRRSMWSRRNVDHIARLDRSGRLRDRGRGEVDLAKSDGRWERAYAGPATAEVPRELVAALDRRPELRRSYEQLPRSEQYALLHPVLTAPGPEVAVRRADRVIAHLERVDPAQADPGSSGPRPRTARTPQTVAAKPPSTLTVQPLT